MFVSVHRTFRSPYHYVYTGNAEDEKQTCGKNYHQEEEKYAFANPVILILYVIAKTPKIIFVTLCVFADVVVEVYKDVPAWPGRHLFEDGEKRRYFGLKTEIRGVVEFECKNQREYEMWTQGVSRLLSMVAERKKRFQH